MYSGIGIVSPPEHIIYTYFFIVNSQMQIPVIVQYSYYIVTLYNINALDKYQASKDRQTILLPRGTKDRIRLLTGETVNGFVNRLVMEELDRIESMQNKP